MTDSSKNRTMWRDIDRYFREASLEGEEEACDYEFVFDPAEEPDDESFTVPFDYESDEDPTTESDDSTAATYA